LHGDAPCGDTALARARLPSEPATLDGLDQACVLKFTEPFERRWSRAVERRLGLPDAVSDRSIVTAVVPGPDFDQQRARANRQGLPSVAADKIALELNEAVDLHAARLVVHSTSSQSAPDCDGIFTLMVRSVSRLSL
jgi:hypothetical protein